MKCPICLRGELTPPGNPATAGRCNGCEADFGSVNAELIRAAYEVMTAARETLLSDSVMIDQVELTRLQKLAGESTEQVNHPSHYNQGRFEIIDVIEDWQLGFNDGNTVKYVGRARHKGKELEDLQKALWYLQRRINEIKAT